MELVRLRANSQNRPCVDQPPYFSWVIVSEGQNVMQETYRIRVWSDRGEAWDSGVVKSDQSAFVDYEGKALDSLTDYMLSMNGQYPDKMIWLEYQSTPGGSRFGRVFHRRASG